MKPWIIDASPFVFLATIDRLSVLKDQAPAVLMPRAVEREILVHRDQAAADLHEASRSWLDVAEVEDKLALDLLLPSLGAGEAAVVALAK